MTPLLAFASVLFASSAPAQSGTILDLGNGTSPVQRQFEVDH
jgi:hypothetical protein